MTSTQEAEADEVTPGGRGSGPLRVLRELVLVVLVAIIVSALLRAFVLQAFVVPTGSMEHTIRKDERIVVQKFGDVERGQVIVFEDPGGWIGASEEAGTPRGPVGQALEFVGLLPSSAHNHLVKRVVGVPGDHVVCCDRRGRVTVNDQPLSERGYLFPGDVPSEERFDVVVPEDALWVMGDHRARSGDSRCHLVDGTAFVPLDRVTGRAVAIVWPLSSARTLPAPDTFDSVPDPGPAPAAADVRTTSQC